MNQPLLVEGCSEVTRPTYGKLRQVPQRRCQRRGVRRDVPVTDRNRRKSCTCQYFCRWGWSIGRLGKRVQRSGGKAVHKIWTLWQEAHLIETGRGRDQSWKGIERDRFGSRKGGRQIERQIDR